MIGARLRQALRHFRPQTAATYADWRWIFLINLPLGAAALWLLVRHLPDPVSPSYLAHRTVVHRMPSPCIYLPPTAMPLTLTPRQGAAWSHRRDEGNPEAVSSQRARSPRGTSALGLGEGSYRRRTRRGTSRP